MYAFLVCYVPTVKALLAVMLRFPRVPTTTERWCTWRQNVCRERSNSNTCTHITTSMVEIDSTPGVNDLLTCSRVQRITTLLASLSGNLNIQINDFVSHRIVRCEEENENLDLCERMCVCIFLNCNIKQIFKGVWEKVFAVVIIVSYNMNVI